MKEQMLLKELSEIGVASLDEMRQRGATTRQLESWYSRGLIDMRPDNGFERGMLGGKGVIWLSKLGEVLVMMQADALVRYGRYL